MVTLRDEKDVLSFLSFLLVEPGRRYSSLKRLRIAAARLFPQRAFQLGEFTRRASCLSAVPSNSNTQSKLQVARIYLQPSYDDTEGGDDQHPDYRNPFKILRHSQDTLTHLTCTFPETLSSHAFPIEERYPHVTSLDLESYDLPSTAAFAYIFPNLRELRFDIATGDGDTHFSGYSSSHIQSFPCRQQNKAEQKANGTWPRLDECRARIPDLYRFAFSCRVRKLNIMGALMDTIMLEAVMEDACPEYLCLRNFDDDLFSDKLSMQELMRVVDKPPFQQLKSLEVVLTVGATLGRETSVRLRRAMNNMLEMLRHLSLSSFGLVFISYLDDDLTQNIWSERADPDDAPAERPMYISRASNPDNWSPESSDADTDIDADSDSNSDAGSDPDSVTDLDSDSNADSSAQSDTGMDTNADIPSSSTPELRPAERYLHDLDLTAFAQRIMDTAPTLESVAVTLRRHRTRPFTVAQVGKSASDWGEDAVEAIPSKAAPGYRDMHIPPYIRI
ncbi:hypothetical protein LXA43DRAFT_1097129 [Ganoderma leucocontextum]|nr:hypothetical protein LXA43DRAFT_1097129 [Ganoderma leucocontextum]